MYQKEKEEIDKNTRIRLAIVDDAEEINYIKARSWLFAYEHVDSIEKYNVTKEDIMSRGFVSDGLKREETRTVKTQKQIHESKLQATSCCFVAEIGDKIVGLVWPQIDGKENKVGMIYVDPDFIGRGIGKELMQRVFDYFPNQNIYLEVSKFNAKVIEFYKKLGFEIIPGYEDDKPVGESGKFIPCFKMVRKAKTI